jgi:regulator of replication initiation timing
LSDRAGAGLSAQPDEPESDPIPEKPAEFGKTFLKILTGRKSLSFWGATGFAVATVLAGLLLSEKSEGYKKSLLGLLADGFEPPLSAQTEVKGWLALATFLVVVFALAFAYYSISRFWKIQSLEEQVRSLWKQKRRVETSLAGTATERDKLKGENLQLEMERDSLRSMLETERDRVQKTLEARNNTLRRTLGETIGAASRIRSQMFPAAVHGAGKTIESVHYLYYIDKHFNTEVHRRYLIRAGDTPMHFWQIAIGVSSEAAPIETFVDLGYRLISHDMGKDLVYLPTRDELHDKAACVYFLPYIAPKERRDIEVTYRWPKMMRQLQTQGWENCSVKLNNAGPLQSYSFEVYLEPGTGGMLSCVESGVPLPNKKMEPAISHHGWPGWKYSASEIAATLLNTEISLTVEWNRS